MKAKIQYCPKCHNKMKYRGSHKFLCMSCNILWERSEWIKVKDIDNPKLFSWHRQKGWKYLVKNAKR